MKHTLICVIGLQPQSVTLALHNLLLDTNSPTPIDEVFVITTKDGEQMARTLLLEPDHGHFHKFLKEFGISKSAINFTTANIRVIRGEDLRPLAGLETEVHNKLAADHISEFLRKLTKDPERAIHLCIADGCTALAFYAGHALSLYGREQDKLKQVLINHELVGHPDFFFPPKQAREVLLSNTQRLFNTKEAMVQLANVPYVRLRNHLPMTMLNQIEQGMGWGEVVSKAQSNLANVAIALDCQSESIFINGTELNLQAKPRAFLWWMAIRKLTLDEGEYAIATTDSEEPFMALYREFADASIHEYANNEGEFEPGEVSALVSKIRNGILDQFGQGMLDYFGQFKQGPYGVSKYGLFGIRPDQITLVNDHTGNGWPCRHHVMNQPTTSLTEIK